MIYRRPVLAGIVLLLAIMLTACSGGGGNNSGRIQAVVTTGMIADVVKNVGGERVDVIQLMGPGVDPHLYKATESDVNKLSGADIVFYNGLNLEARMTGVFEQIGRSRPSIAVGDAIPQDLLLNDPRYENQPDPHVWMDVKLWAYTIDAVANALGEMDAEHKETYERNATAYRQTLTELNEYVNAQVAQTPEQKRVLITAHDAFQYFGKGYGYEVFAPQGISTEAEAGVDDIRRIIDLAVARDIPAIFVETSVPPDVIEAIIAGARARGHELSIGGSLFSDAMGDPATPAGAYPGMIRHNIDTIVAPLLP